MTHPADIKLILGDKPSLPFAPGAEVVGIDQYSFTACDGRKHKWESYTLTSLASGRFNRFWIANVPDDGGFLFTARDEYDLPVVATFNPKISGLCQLQSEGDASLSSAFSALSCWQTGDGTLYSTEVFNETAPMHFFGRPITLRA